LSPSMKRHTAASILHPEAPVQLFVQVYDIIQYICENKNTLNVLSINSIIINFNRIERKSHHEKDYACGLYGIVFGELCFCSVRDSGGSLGKEQRWHGTDTQTGLMWADHDSSDINWGGAVSYCEGYSGGGKTGWRMPTIDELTNLYSSGAYGTVIKRTSSFVWSSQTNGPLMAAVFYFNGGAIGWDHQSYTGGFRALPVRKVQ
ncbi:MAG: DUF1566 domain-containing protein, partial [Candidatus Omnitrophota bacterium]